ncbi:IclR family transcriptional regulator [Aquimarina sp. BL5]|uniref:IclR family transcriptional regulator n=2 Tax=Aquimarina sp. BL5 TaxID=1714860 RepID=UPI000E503916|nr:IclR family transcriptional regulator [Aquimarina sp. BL5]AXT50242.1 IclR family transcriptional regulator [Aquimarina sp. BL5]RKN09558.1 IclR family transcriptional regulator [Aquimarina sp. BL5]
MNYATRQLVFLNLKNTNLKMKKEKPLKYNAPALNKGLDIIEYLSKEGIPQSQAEIAQGINRTPSEIYRMLVCLEERGYILRGVNAGKYRLSLKMYSLSHTHTPFDELKRVARYPMQELSEKTRQSCHLSIINNDQLLVISQIRSPNAVSLSIEEGTHFPLSMTTSGMTLLSMLSQENRETILSRDAHYKKWKKEQKEELYEAITTIGKTGYRYAMSKLTSGVTDIAIPIGLKDSELSAVLAISVFSSSLENELNIKDILNDLKNTQQKINKLICN